MNLWMYVLLVGAVGLLLASTIQFKFWLRLAIWIFGAAALALCAWFATHGVADNGFVRAIADVLTNASAPMDSIVWQALWGNQDTVAGALVPMLDLYLVIAAGLAFFTLVALTPGEAIERLVRPLCLIIIGALFGGVLALAVTAIGIGDYDKRRVYVGVASDVIDGDTFRLGGEVSLRLDGIDALEADQVCFSDAAQIPCGDEARAALAEILDTNLVICGRRGIAPEERARAGAPRETFSRPLVQCWVRTESGDLDVAQTMAARGYAVEWDLRSGPYASDVAQARAEARGMWDLCGVAPNAWRNEDGIAEAFVSQGFEGVDSALTLGACGLTPP